MQPKIIDLRDLDMGRAYDFTQGDQVQHGDVLLVSDGVAIMDRAWPVMVAGAAGLELADAALVGGAA